MAILLKLDERFHSHIRHKSFMEHCHGAMQQRIAIDMSDFGHKLSESEHMYGGRHAE